MNVTVKHLAAGVVLTVLAFVAPARAMDIQVVPVQGVGQVWLVENHSLPIIAVDLAFKGAGAAQDPDGKVGLATFVSGMLDEGAGDLDSQAFQKRLSDLSISLSFSVGQDDFAGSMKTLTENREEAFRLLGLSINAPRFDAADIDRVRDQLIAAINESEQRPATVASREWAARAYPGHAYGRPVGGRLQTIPAITRADLAAFADAKFARGNLIIVVVGDIDAAEVSKLVAGAFAPLPEKPNLIPVPDMVAVPPAGILVIDRPIPQSNIVFGLPGIKRDDPEWFPASVMNYVLGGGGFASRLMDEVREKRGLAYSVRTGLSPQDHSGLLLGSVGTRNDSAKDSIDIIRRETAKMHDSGITAAELDGAKKYLTGSYPLAFDTSPNIAAQLLAIRLEGFATDYVEKRNGYIEAVTLEQTNASAKRLLDAEAISWLVVGRPTGISSTVK
ncbi:M16 family metallopeptidase [Govanella unica]|uniref:Insulinase family protein n=1 Tax=Govanella unica TaxID=2975056 RepID=A0A9X3TYB5_9PROT|nr:pitrilysin family protein [Govania unica]MDA5193945.1 insulinase family protein [Govania unica]